MENASYKKHITRFFYYYHFIIKLYIIILFQKPVLFSETRIVHHLQGIILDMMLNEKKKVIECWPFIHTKKIKNKK